MQAPWSSHWKTHERLRQVLYGKQTYYIPRPQALPKSYYSTLGKRHACTRKARKKSHMSYVQDKIEGERDEKPRPSHLSERAESSRDFRFRVIFSSYTRCSRRCSSNTAQLLGNNENRPRVRSFSNNILGECFPLNQHREQKVLKPSAALSAASTTVLAGEIISDLHTKSGRGGKDRSYLVFAEKDRERKRWVEEKSSSQKKSKHDNGRGKSKTMETGQCSITGHILMIFF